MAYVDSDVAGDPDSRKSTSGSILMLNGLPIVWKTMKQKTVATSTTEAEFMAECAATKGVIWVEQLITELRRNVNYPTVLNIDNQGAIKIINNDQIHSKTKHLDVKYMFVRETVKDKKYCRNISKLIINWQMF